jgi:hypothetical protein
LWSRQCGHDPLIHTFPPYRPKLKRFQTYEEALAAVTEIMAKEAQVGARGGMLGAIDEGEEIRGRGPSEGVPL